MRKLVLFCLVLVLALGCCTAYAGDWVCPNCGSTNSKNYCPNCGAKSPQWICPECGEENCGNFCENCGMPNPADADEDETAAPGTEDDDASAALERLLFFCNYWSANSLDEMVELCAPSWAEKQENTRTSLFALLANRTIVAVEPEEVTVTDPDLECSVVIRATIDRNNGNPAALYLMTIAMVKENGEWYIDPECLLTYEPVGTQGQGTNYIARPTPEPVFGGPDAAVTRVVEFFSLWAQNRLDDMLKLCAPDWYAQQEKPLVRLFALTGNRIPQQIEVAAVSGTAEDASREVTLTALIDRNNGKPAEYYLMKITVVKENGEWYVDPESLQAGGAPETAEESAVSPDTVLYYNPTGGQYYHLDQNCLSVNPKFQPLGGHFTYGEINDEKYDGLEPCNICGAPPRP